MTSTTITPEIEVLSQLVARVQQITPERARQLLETNTNNRNISEPLVMRYAHAMTAGHWHLNGETIKLDTHGNLLDGQHRLAAIQRANITVPMLVAEGMSPETFTTIDQGRPRSFADVFSIKGNANASTLVSVLKLVALYEHFDRTLWRMFETDASPYALLAVRSLSITDLEITAQRHPTIVAIVQQMASRRRIRTLMPASLAAFLFWVFSEVDSDTAALLFDSMENGANLRENDPIYVLRERLLAMGSDRRMRPLRTYRYITGVTVKTWNQIRTGHHSGHLRMGKNDLVPDVI